MRTEALVVVRQVAGGKQTRNRAILHRDLSGPRGSQSTWACPRISGLKQPIRYRAAPVAPRALEDPRSITLLRRGDGMRWAEEKDQQVTTVLGNLRLRSKQTSSRRPRLPRPVIRVVYHDLPSPMEEVPDQLFAALQDLLAQLVRRLTAFAAYTRISKR